MTTFEHPRPGQSAGKPRPRVAVVVLTWNGRQLTLECLESLAALKYENVHIIVVDNASTDGTVEALQAAYGEAVTTLVNDDNLGFAGGNNVGIHYALDHGFDYVLLLNNDTVVDPGLIGHMLAVFDTSPGAGIVGPKILYASPPDQIWFAGGEIHLARGTSRHIGIRQKDRGQCDEVRDVDYVSGCALMAKRGVFEAIGGLDTAYHAYFEDADFCMRAKRSGFRVLYAPAGKVWHKISASMGGQFSRRKVSLRLKSAVRFFRRYSSFRDWLTIPLFFSLDVIRILTLTAMGRIRDTGEAKRQDASGRN